MIKIKFSEKQYEELITLAYLGNWMIGAYEETPGKFKNFEDLERHICSFAKGTKVEHLIDYCNDLKGHYPNADFDEKMSKYIDNYNEECFWDELTHNLARRDVLEKYGDKFYDMDFSQKIDAENPFLGKYDEEFYKNGLDNLRIVDNSHWANNTKR